MKNHKNKKGFTLIELLVVIAIIGLLSTLAVVSLSAARTRARDVKRLADLRNFQSALELYASDKGTYPKYAIEELINDGAGGCLDGAETADKAFKESGCTTVLMSLKPDAVDADKYAYKYQSDTDGTKYKVWVKTEGKAGVCAKPEGITEDVASDACTL